MKTEYFVMIFIFAMIMMIHAKPVHADSADPFKILDVHVEPGALQVNDKFLISATILNISPYPVYLTSGSCTPAFSVVFDMHVKQVYPNISCTTEAIIQKVDPLQEVTISNANKPGTIYQAVMAGTANAKITIPYFAKNQTSTDYSNVDYTISKSFQFLIHKTNNTKQETPIENATTPIHVHGHLVTDKTVDSPLKQSKSGIKPEDVKCREGFMLVTKASNGIPACVTQNTYFKLVNRGWTVLENSTYTAWVFVNGTRYSIPYVIRGWDNGLSSSITFDFASKSLVVPLKSVAEKGEITLTIPKALMDTNLGQEAQFIVLLDGHEAQHKETISGNARMITVPFGFGAQKIEIIAPQRI